MSIETYQFNLPITPGSIPPVLHLSQYDTGRTFTAVLRDDSNVPFELEPGATAVIKGFNAAGVAWQQDCTISGASVIFTPYGAATDQFGVMPVTIEITEAEQIISPLCVIFDIQRAGYTNEQAANSPEFQTALEAAIAEAIAQGGLGFSDDFKQALLACFNGVAWATPDGQTLVDDLEAALYPDIRLVSITAAYEQDRPIYDTDSLDLVRLDLVVTANYSDGTSERLADDAYTLTGTLTPGTSTITVSYQGKTDTIEVIVTYKVYQDVEWIETDGACRIDTGVAFDGTKDIVATLEFAMRPNVSYTAGTSILFGWSAGGALGVIAKPGHLYSYLGSETAVEDSLPIDDTMTTCEMTIQAGSATNTVGIFTNRNGTKTMTRTHTNVANRTFLDFPLFALSAQSDFSFSQDGLRIKSCKIKVGGTTVRKMRAVYRREDNVIGFYDEITDSFKTNLGTGAFTKGADI